MTKFLQKDLSVPFTGKNLYQILYLMKLQALACTFIAKESPAQMFSCEFCAIFKNTFLRNSSGRLLYVTLQY